jgi:hypothetical protein
VGGRKGPAFRWSDDLVLSVDVWLSPGSRLSVRMQNVTQGMTHTFTPAAPPAEAWTRLTLRFRDFFPAELPRRFRDGDRISPLILMVEERPDAALFVDNLEISRETAERPIPADRRR